MREAEGMGAHRAGTMEEDGYWRILDGLAATSTIVIDRPKGTSHPRYPTPSIRLIMGICAIRRR